FQVGCGRLFLRYRLRFSRYRGRGPHWFGRLFLWTGFPLGIEGSTHLGDKFFLHGTHMIFNTGAHVVQDDQQILTLNPQFLTKLINTHFGHKTTSDYSIRAVSNCSSMACAISGARTPTTARVSFPKARPSSSRFARQYQRIWYVRQSRSTFSLVCQAVSVARRTRDNLPPFAAWAVAVKPSVNFPAFWAI